MLSHKQCPVDEILEIRCNIAMRKRLAVFYKRKKRFLRHFMLVATQNDKEASSNFVYKVACT